MSTGISIRTELFEHGIFPTPPKLTLVNLASLINSLNLVTSVDNKVTIDQFKESACKYIPFMTAKDAEVYFTIFKVITEDDMSFLNKPMMQSQSSSSIKSNSFSNKNGASAANSAFTADAKALALFLYLQTLLSSTRHHLDSNKKDFNASWGPHMNLQFNESIRGNNFTHFNSPINSPRSKTTKIYFATELQQIAYFIKNNIKTILKLLANDITAEETANMNITEADFNLLKIMFYNEKNELKSPKQNLSKISGLFTTTTKVNINAAAEWIATNLTINDNTDVFSIQQLNRGVTIKDKAVVNNKEVRIIGCDDSHIYIDGSVKSICIVNCINTTVFVASVKKICTIDKCENVNITVAANFLRIGNTIDSTINYYGSFNPVLYGDNRSLIIGPFNANYMELVDKIKDADIPIIYKNIQSYDNPIVLNSPENNDVNHKIQKIEDYNTMILPDIFKPISYALSKNYDPLVFGFGEKSTNNNSDSDTVIKNMNVTVPILCPNVYRDQIKQRFKSFADLQNDIKSMNYTEEEQKMLQFAIQSSFKDWFVSNAIKPVLEMVKMIDKD
jgi:TBCC domain-containing protein 1